MDLPHLHRAGLPAGAYPLPDGGEVTTFRPGSHNNDTTAALLFANPYAMHRRPVSDYDAWWQQYRQRFLAPSGLLESSLMPLGMNLLMRNSMPIITQGLVQLGLQTKLGLFLGSTAVLSAVISGATTLYRLLGPRRGDDSPLKNWAVGILFSFPSMLLGMGALRRWNFGQTVLQDALLEVPQALVSVAIGMGIEFFNESAGSQLTVGERFKIEFIEGATAMLAGRLSGHLGRPLLNRLTLASPVVRHQPTSTDDCDVSTTSSAPPPFVPDRSLTPLMLMAASDGRRGRRPLFSGGKPLRPYQREMLAGLSRDIEGKVSPWLGLSSPPQTGKSDMIPRIIELLRFHFIWGPETRIYILTSARVITDQVVKDLTSGLPSHEIGRFDGRPGRAIRRITVCSIPAMARNLKLFPPTEETVLINDEGITTQTGSCRRIYTHFGLGQMVREGKKLVLRPRTGNGLVIGLAGTAGGLFGYHKSGALDLMTSVRDGWIRPLEGEPIHLRDVTTQKRRGHGERMIWWRATRQNALRLADVYDQKIRGRFANSLIYVPTIRHGRLLTETLQKRFGPNAAHVVHSQMSEEEYQATMERWRKSGGALISVRMLSRGFRATGVQAIFHTYQTSSPELFVQRTGRAWGIAEGSELPPLFILEAIWERRPLYTNLARLLCLVDYPATRLDSRDVPALLREIGIRKEQEAAVAAAIDRGEVEPAIRGIPVSPSWKQVAGRAVESAGGVEDTARKTGLTRAKVRALSQGVLPVSLAEVKTLATLLGGEEGAAGIWSDQWRAVLEEVLRGSRDLRATLRGELAEWARGSGSPLERAHALAKILSRHYATKIRKGPTLERDRVIACFQEALEGLEAAIQKRGGEATTAIVPLDVAQRAHEIYCRDLLAGGLRPSLGQFEMRMYRGAGSEEIRRLVLAAGLQFEVKAKLIESAIWGAFRWALREMRPRLMAARRGEGPPVRISQVSALAYGRYCQILRPDEFRPNAEYFARLTKGKGADPKLLELMRRRGVEKREIVEIDREGARAAFREALGKMRRAIQIGRGPDGTNRVSAGQVGDRARGIYIAKLPTGSPHPTPKGFRSLVHSAGRGYAQPDPEVVALLKSAGIEKKETPKVDDERMVASFRQALEELRPAIERGRRGEGRRIFPQPVATRACAIYCAASPAGEKRPTAQPFHRAALGSKKVPAVTALLAEYGVEKQSSVRLDYDRVREAYRQVLEEMRGEIERGNRPGGQPVPLSRVGRRAWEFYVAGLPADQPRPAEDALVAVARYEEEYRDEALMEMLGGAGLLRKTGRRRPAT